VVGIMRVTGPAVPDGDEGGWVKVPMAPVRPLPPVTLKTSRPSRSSRRWSWSASRTWSEDLFLRAGQPTGLRIKHPPAPADDWRLDQLHLRELRLGLDVLEGDGRERPHRRHRHLDPAALVAVRHGGPVTRMMPTTDGPLPL